ncbi:MAG: tetratricopeptide repeat protein, partial [Paracraurococcus sp.]
MDRATATPLATKAIGACAVGGLAWMSGGVATVLAAGIAGNVADRAAGRLLGEVRDRLGRLRGLPANHDFARGVRQAQLHALERVIRDFAARHPGADPAFTERALAFCREVQGHALGAEVSVNEDLTAPLGAAIQGILAGPGTGLASATVAEQIAGLVEAAVLEELRARLAPQPVPPAFEAQFRDGADALPRFLDAYGAHVVKAINQPGPFQAIFTAGALARIEGLGFDTAEGVQALAERFGGIEVGLGRIEDAQAREVRLAAERHAELLAAIAREKGVPHGVLRALLARMGETGVPEAAIEARLAAKAEEYVALRAELDRRGNDRPEAAAARARAGRLLEAGDLDAARAVLAEGRGRLRALRKQTAREEAGLAAEEARVAALALRYREAAALYEEAAALVGFDAEVAWWYLLLAADRKQAQGGEYGDNPALHEALVTYDRALSLAPRAARPLDWATTQNDLGNALARLGERGNEAALQRAVAAYRAALEERTRERVPLDWAMTQNNLGNALLALGRRGDDEALRRAVAAYRTVLEEFIRERVPLAWATTQNNLGNALLTLGRRGDDEALPQAVAAYNAALEERTRERVPLDWAMTQNNLGNALLTLGRRGDDEALPLAVKAYKAALEERTRDRVPLDWATTQNNLGNALLALGERGDEAALPQAVAAYEAALQERTRERVPLDWAMTQNNL